MEQVYNIALTKTEIAEVFSALGFLLIEGAGHQAMSDTSELKRIEAYLDDALGSDKVEIFGRVEKLARRFAESFKEAV